MRKNIIAGNWKMHNTIAESLELVEGIKENLINDDNVEVVLCPPYTALADCAKALQGTGISLGSQNMYFEEKGAFTGEIAPNMLKDAGCTYAIIGHSERRAIFGETNALINKKVKAAIGNSIKAILCVGETLEDREANRTFDVVEDHLRGGLDGIEPEAFTNILVAYEPVWAIGTGKTATPDQAQEVHSFIRQKIQEIFSQQIADQIQILYGGSVKPDNINDLIGQSDIDGALVGGASLKADSFLQIIQGAQTVKGV